ncbi:MAG: ATP-binding protein [Bacillota bacterium]
MSLRDCVPVSLGMTKEQFSKIINILRDIVLVFDEHGYVVEVSRTALQVYGYSYEDFIGLHVTTLRIDSPEKVESQFNTALTRAVFFEAIHKKKDGSNLYVEVSSQPFMIKDNIVVVSTIRDITERKQAEENQKKLINEIQYNYLLEQKLSDISRIILQAESFDKTIDAVLAELGTFTQIEQIFIFTLLENNEYVDNTHVWCSNASKIKIEKRKSFPVYRIKHWMEKLSKGDLIVYDSIEDIPENEADEKQLMYEYGVISIAIFPMLVRNKLLGFITIESKDRIFSWSNSTVYLASAASDLIAMAFSKHYIDDKLRLSNNELQNALIELNLAQGHLILHEKMAAIGQLVAGIAHEINNPLGFITSNLSTLKNYKDKINLLIDACLKLKSSHISSSSLETYDELRSLNDILDKNNYSYIHGDLNDLINETYEGIERIVRIVKELKLFSRQNDEDKFEEYDLNEGIKTVLVITRNETKYNAEVNFAEGKIPLIIANGDMINQVLLNIVINAVHAIKAKGQADLGEIRICTYEMGKNVFVEISDNGIGIPPNSIGNIFTPFYTTKPIGQGTGLGLYISYDIIVNKHHGKIDVESVEGEGTTFKISLPIQYSQ